MIPSKELRRGNLVKINENVRPLIKDWIFEVDELYSKDAYIINRVTSQAGTMLYEDLDPVPLSEDILVKAGGQKNKATPFYEIDLPYNVGQLQVNPNNGVVWLRHHRIPETNINPMSTNPYHVHQLQNLYFSLTGQELNIQL